MTYADMIADLRKNFSLRRLNRSESLTRATRAPEVWNCIADVLEETGKYIEAERVCLDSEGTWTPEAQGKLQNAANAIYENFRSLLTTWQRLQGEIQP